MTTHEPYDPDKYDQVALEDRVVEQVDMMAVVNALAAKRGVEAFPGHTIVGHSWEYPSQHLIVSVDDGNVIRTTRLSVVDVSVEENNNG